MKTALFLLLSLISQPLLAQHPLSTLPDSVKQMLDKSFAILQNNAINRDTVNWPILKEQIYQKVAQARSYQDIAVVYPYLFQRIGDHHGALRLGTKTYSWKPDQQPYTNQAVIKAIKAYPTVRVQLIDKHTGYILLPGNSDFRGKTINADAQAIRDAIQSINKGQIRQWILDLRVNTGGSMYQMLAGLAPLLGEGRVGQFVNQHKQPDGAWTIKAGNIYLDTLRVSSIASDPAAGGFRDKPLAVLISGQTASSGEVVAIATIGRPKTVLIGENTAGYTTANQGFALNGYAGLNLAVDYYADRQGRIYTDFIRPDLEERNGDNFEDLGRDEKIKTALKWLQSH